MSAADPILKGTIHGKTIQLDREPGLPEGQEVTVMVVPVQRHSAPGVGIRRSAGAWADDEEGLDEYLDWNRRQRKEGRAEIHP